MRERVRKFLKKEGFCPKHKGFYFAVETIVLMNETGNLRLYGAGGLFELLTDMVGLDKSYSANIRWNITYARTKGASHPEMSLKEYLVWVLVMNKEEK